MPGQYSQIFDNDQVKTVIPLPFENIAGLMSMQQGNIDKVNDKLGELEDQTIVKGGRRTQERAKAFNSQIQSQIEQEANNIMKDPSSAGQSSFKIQRLKHQILNSPEYQDIKSDELATEYADKQLLQPNFNQHIQNFYNPNEGYSQTKPGERFNANWYKSIAPGDVYAEHKPLFDAIKPKISRYYNDPNYH